VNEALCANSAFRIPNSELKKASIRLSSELTLLFYSGGADALSAVFKIIRP
jgi:hypothetical protein